MFARHHHDAIGIGYNNVAGCHHDAATTDREVDLSGTAMEWADHILPAGIDRETQRADRRRVPDITIDNETRYAAVPGLGADYIAEHRVLHRSARVDDYGIARPRNVESFVDHEIVTRKDLDSDGRADQGPFGTSDASDRAVDA